MSATVGSLQTMESSVQDDRVMDMSATVDYQRTNDNFVQGEGMENMSATVDNQEVMDNSMQGDEGNTETGKDLDLLGGVTVKVKQEPGEPDEEEVSIMIR